MKDKGSGKDVSEEEIERQKAAFIQKLVEIIRKSDMHKPSDNDEEKGESKTKNTS